jgi:hypothetical protein
MVVAGVVLLKHPQYTHRLYYLLALRKQLPANTPYFDIGIHHRTNSGIQSPHLVIRCGENHQEILTEILSDYLDGKQTTAIYIGNKFLQSMTQEATEDLFNTHQKYVNAIQRLPLSPMVVNIDRVRIEKRTSGDQTSSRSTRAWANSLQTPDGKSFQCDAENGGPDKKAYLLVPERHVSAIQKVLQQYKNNIRANRDNQAPFAEKSRDCPDEIYVPTASVQRNVDFLRNMSSADIWKNAPSTIRCSHPPAVGGTVTTNPLKSHKEVRPTPITNSTDTSPYMPNFAPTPAAHLSQDHATTSQENVTLHRTSNSPLIRQIDDNTTATFNSATSTTLNPSQKAQRFTELEQSMRITQQDLKNMNQRYETMETRMLETMSSCHLNTQQLVTMQGQMTTFQCTMQGIADQMNLIMSHITRPSEGKRDTGRINQSPVKKKVKQTSDQGQEVSGEGEQDKTNSTTPLTQDNSSQNTSSLTADQAESQYNSNRFPGSAMEE